MCTGIGTTCDITGMGKGSDGWFPLSQVSVGYDHASHTGDEHAVLLDFSNYTLGVDARVGVELDLASGWVLLVELERTLRRAEASGV